MKIGFTGTQKGMTDIQKSSFSTVISEFFRGASHKEFHHGDCIGADAEAHQLILDYNHELWFDYEAEVAIHIHPPTNESKQAKCEFFEKYYKPAPYLTRNRDIVNACNILVATSAYIPGVEKGGTWYTINYAKTKKTIPIWIIYPDGTVDEKLYYQLLKELKNESGKSERSN